MLFKDNSRAGDKAWPGGWADLMKKPGRLGLRPGRPAEIQSRAFHDHLRRGWLGHQLPCFPKKIRVCFRAAQDKDLACFKYPPATNGGAPRILAAPAGWAEGPSAYRQVFAFSKWRIIIAKTGKWRS